MTALRELEEQLRQITTLTSLTEAFEGIASSRIRLIKDNVIRSRQFFNELWQIYSQLRLDPSSDLARQQRPRSGRNLVIAITSPAGLTGDIDLRIIESLLDERRGAVTDVVVFGGHGAVLLNERGVKPIQVFNLPDITQPLDVRPITRLLDIYGRATVYFESFVSLSVQRVARIELLNAIETMSQSQTDQPSSVINLSEYIVEPSVADVITFLQSVMMTIALVQVMFEARLAQYASRFNTMLVSNDTAKKLQNEAQLACFRARRAQRDERLKETIFNRGRL